MEAAPTRCPQWSPDGSRISFVSGLLARRRRRRRRRAARAGGRRRRAPGRRLVAGRKRDRLRADRPRGRERREPRAHGRRRGRRAEALLHGERRLRVPTSEGAEAPSRSAAGRRSTWAPGNEILFSLVGSRALREHLRGARGRHRRARGHAARPGRGAADVVARREPDRLHGRRRRARASELERQRDLDRRARGHGLRQRDRQPRGRLLAALVARRQQARVHADRAARTRTRSTSPTRPAAPRCGWRTTSRRAVRRGRGAPSGWPGLAARRIATRGEANVGDAHVGGYRARAVGAILASSEDDRFAVHHRWSELSPQRTFGAGTVATSPRRGQAR